MDDDNDDYIDDNDDYIDDDDWGWELRMIEYNNWWWEFW